MTMGFSLYDTNKITIGNIPHKVAFRTWAADNMYEMSAKIKVCWRNNINCDKNVSLFDPIMFKLVGLFELDLTVLQIETFFLFYNYQLIIQETYPNLPNYGGEKYIYFETKEVREDPGAVEEATNEKDPIFDDGNIPEDEDSSDDSSDSDDDDQMNNLLSNISSDMFIVQPSMFKLDFIIRFIGVKIVV